MLRDALFCQILVRTNVGNSAKHLAEKIMNKGREPRQTLLIQALVDIHQRKSLKLNMKEPLELEPLRTIDKIRKITTKSSDSLKSLWDHL